MLSATRNSWLGEAKNPSAIGSSRCNDSHAAERICASTSLSARIPQKASPTEQHSSAAFSPRSGPPAFALRLCSPASIQDNQGQLPRSSRCRPARAFAASCDPALLSIWQAKSYLCGEAGKGNSRNTWGGRNAASRASRAALHSSPCAPCATHAVNPRRSRCTRSRRRPANLNSWSSSTQSSMRYVKTRSPKSPAAKSSVRAVGHWCG
mmetsp:Transcript_67752/g.211945  ORF Transcript_67752/g.211945 Transcript_67752/m.211945 type:complete len:208 (-) Transcript_67752:186-809(-)